MAPRREEAGAPIAADPWAPLGRGSERDAERTVEILRSPLEHLPDPLPLSPIPGPFHAEVSPPGSKSITNRLLVLAALAAGESRLRRPLVEADDARVMMRGLAQLGADILPDTGPRGEPALRVIGVGGRPLPGGTLHLENSGTSVRFLAAAAALASGPVAIDGSTRMRERPIDDLTAMLRSLRVRVEDLGQRGFPPLRIHGVPDVPLRGGKVTVTNPKSSQFVTALMLIGPWTTDGVEIAITGEVTSKSYIRMTAALLRRLGAEIRVSPDCRSITVGPKPIAPFETTVEPDASGATYFWAAGAICPQSICGVPGVSPTSLQGDARFVNTLAAMGAMPHALPSGISVEAPDDGEMLRGIGADMSLMPDAAMTLAAVACFARTPSVMAGVQTLRVKECDRIAATQAELAKVGAAVEATDRLMRITPPVKWTDEPVLFETYDDHRMAMSLALIGLRRPNVLIANPQCVAKTYPTFWSDLAALYEAAL
jgi:3-phosphoshikimate 1-carboxyvinyltransferase